jgi:hypothetical protein
LSVYGSGSQTVRRDALERRQKTGKFIDKKSAQKRKCMLLYQYVMTNKHIIATE